MKTKRTYNKAMLTEDIPLLQECCFIQHKAALKKYLTELKDKEEKEFQELKVRKNNKNKTFSRKLFSVIKYKFLSFRQKMS